MCILHHRASGRRGTKNSAFYALTRDRTGRIWRLADTYSACANATGNTTVIPDMLSPSAPPQNSLSGRTRRKHGTVHGADEQRRVPEMLTYLAVTLPRFTSHATRLLALHWAPALWAMSSRAQALLRAIRLQGRSEGWADLEDVGWLLCAPSQRSLVPGPAARRRHADPDYEPARPQPGSALGMHPVPRSAEHRPSPALRLTTLTLTVRNRGAAGCKTSSSSPDCAECQPPS